LAPEEGCFLLQRCRCLRSQKMSPQTEVTRAVTAFSSEDTPEVLVKLRRIWIILGSNSGQIVENENSTATMVQLMVPQRETVTLRHRKPPESALSWLGRLVGIRKQRRGQSVEYPGGGGGCFAVTSLGDYPCRSNVCRRIAAFRRQAVTMRVVAHRPI